MKQLKLLFLTTTFLFSSFTFVAEGGICASKRIKAEEELNPEATDETTVSGGRAADAVAEAAAAVGQSDQDKRNMKLIMAKWFKYYCPRVNGLLAECLLGAPRRVHRAAPEEAPGTRVIPVEWLGSGIVIARRFKITPDTTYQDLTQAVAAALDDGTSPHNLLLFNGHCGDEITSTNFRNLEIQTLVVTRMTQEIYLARQEKAMRALYDLLPDGVSKDGALASLNN